MTGKHTYLRTHTISGAALSFSLSGEDAALRDKAAGAPSGRAAKTLVKDGSLRVTLAALRKGATLQRHQVEGAVSIHVLRGRARIAVGGPSTPAHTEDVGLAQLLVLQEGAPHTAEALSDCTLLITFAMPG
jgi:quercetin dioxygenase-like cupin family protein